MGVVEDFIMLRIQATNEARETIEKVQKGFQLMADIAGRVGPAAEESGTKADGAFKTMQASVDTLTAAMDKLAFSIAAVGNKATAAGEKTKILGAQGQTLSEVSVGAEAGALKKAGSELPVVQPVSGPKPKEPSGGGGEGGGGHSGMGPAIFGGTIAFAGLDIMKQGIEAATAWDTEMRTLANNAGLPVEAVQALGQNFLDMSTKSSVSADQMATAFGKIAGELEASYGPAALTVKNNTDFMTAAMQLSLSTGSSMDSATHGLADTLRAFHMPLEDATKATNDLYNISRLTGQPLEAIEKRMTMLQPRLAGAGLDLDHFTGYLNEMTKAVGSGRSANMMLASSVQAISDAKPGTGAGKELELLGFKLDPTKPQNFQAALGFLHDKFQTMKETPKVAADKIKQFQDALTASNATASKASAHLADLEEKAKTSGGEQGALKQQIDSARLAVEHANMAVDKHAQALSAASGKNSEYQALQAMFGKNAAVMMGIVDGGSAALEANTKQVTSSADAKAAAETKEQSYAAQQEMLKNNMHDLSITIGETLVPALNTMMKAVMPVIQHIANFAKEHKTLTATILIAVTAIGMIIAIVGIVMMVMPAVLAIFGAISAIFGIVATVASTVAFGIAMIGAPVILIIAGIAALIAIIILIITHFQTFKNILGDVGNFIKNIFMDAFNFVTNTLPGWIGSLLGFFGSIPGRLGSMAESIGGAIGGMFRGGINDVIGMLNGVIKWIGDLGGSVLGVSFHIRDAFGGTMPRIPTLDTGGFITQTGLAVVHRGEIVNTAAEVQRGAGGGGGVMEMHHHFDLQGAVIADQRSLDNLLDKLGYRLATGVLPSSGYRGR